MDESRQRREALARLGERLEDFATTGNHRSVLGPEALADAAALTQAVPDMDDDAEAALALGLLYWLRSHLPESSAREEPPGDRELADPPGQSRPDAAPRRLREAVELQFATTAGPRLAQAAAALLEGSGQTGDVDGLLGGIRLLRRALAILPDTDPNRGWYLSNLGGALGALYDMTGDASILAEAAAIGRRAVELTADGHENKGNYLYTLGAVLQTQYKRTGDAATLDEAVTIARQAVAATSEEDPQMPGRLSLLSVSLRLLAERTGDASALEEAAAAGGRAVAALPEGHPKFVAYTINFVNTLRALSERTGNADVLSDAEQATRHAIATITDGDPLRPTLLASLGIVLQTMSARTGDDAALREAIGALHEAVALTPDGHVHRVAHLSNLGNALRTLFERIGDMAALDEAAEVTRLAIASIADGDAAQGVALSNLAAILQRQFERTGDASVLAEEVDIGLRAVAAMDADNAVRASLLGNLAGSLHALFERSGEDVVLDVALEAGRAAVTSAPAGHPFLARYLSNLGRGLQAKSELTGDMDLLAEAVKVRRRAVEITPEQDPERATFMTDLANTIRAQAEQTSDATLLAEAAELSRQAAEATPATHADRAGRLINLATSLRAIARQTADTALAGEAERLYAEAAGLDTAAADMRVIAAYWQAVTNLDNGHAEAALDAVENAVALLPQIAARALGRGDREHRLGRVSTLPGLAVAVAVAAGQYARGVELLEQTRGILLTEGMEDRGDARALRLSAPDLAREYDELLRDFAALDDASQDLVISSATADTRIPDTGHISQSNLDRLARARELAEARQRTAIAWQDLLSRIRQNPGLEKFLLPPPASQLRRQAEEGPIVFVYTSQWSSGALVLTPDGPGPVQYVPLPDMTEHDAYANINRMLQACHNTASPNTASLRRQAQLELLDVLAWMWDAITAPVLDTLGLRGTPQPGQPWSRIWWCPVGALAFLPLHAAGHHRDGQHSGQAPQTVMDRAVSSYTATARAMAYARNHQPVSTAASNSSMLVVAVPDVPHARPLPGVSYEADLLQQLIPDIERLDGPSATHAAVIGTLGAHRVAHFACHGASDWQHTAGSRLLVHDDAVQPLTAAVISRQHLPDAELAYLSACSTAAPHPTTTDEPAHIAAAFQLAGYPQVVATLWPVSDTAAVHIATKFYDQLTGNGSRPIETASSAQALHDATRLLRDIHPHVPTAWAAHVHIGT